ncbi:MAG: response regulator transcription factor [Planctomycetota bacterium]|nr:response regulator transcription factor [Planctomycetota bacterium]
MRILLAEDDPVSLEVMRTYLGRWGHEPVLARNGAQAIAELLKPDAPHVAILDWMMPEKDGVAVCRELRAARPTYPVYVIMLTARSTKEDILRGLDAGADEYIVKPFDPEELHARVRAGVRIVELQTSLSGRIQELEEALSRIKTLQGLLPICAWCHKVRDDKNYWQRVETYISGHTDARFTHSICPDCKKKQIDEVKKHRPEKEPQPE